MVKVNSILTDYAMTKLAALVARTEQAAPHLVELGLDALEAELDKQAEYAPEPGDSWDMCERCIKISQKKATR